ncbi:3'(2'),5'-bisphosphate nucleotidase CysQ [Rhizobiaceae bacterium]|nr:3'(2'),5'-bisphosphate nucleotidase CysQ [Rhizobiaceae bacterium]
MTTTFFPLLEELAREAGRAILEVRDSGFDVDHKGDASPVIEADRAAEAIILAGLRLAYPDIPIVAEEEMSEGNGPKIEADSRFFLVDALDGTREFVRGGEDFTVNIALVEHGVPTVGMVYIPATGVAYGGDAEGAWMRAAGGAQEAVNGGTPGDPTRIVASRSHRTPETDNWIAQAGPHSLLSVGSSLKFCALAEGKADAYPRFGRTMEWDTAAGDAVLRAAGGITVTTDGALLRYGKPAGADEAFANPHFISYARSGDLAEG